jgi:hypothetical protein
MIAAPAAARRSGRAAAGAGIIRTRATSVGNVRRRREQLA